MHKKVMVGELVGLCVAASLGVAAGDICERGRTWWDRLKTECTPCTRCDPRSLAVLLPCEPHRDTVCQPLGELRVWPAHVISDYDYYDYADYDKPSDDSVWAQTAALSVAVTGCVVFFVVVVALSLYHAKQWRVIKKALKSDMRDLTARLKLMEAGVAPPVQPAAHIYCNIHAPKHTIDTASPKHGPGNVYTQNKRPS